MSKSRLTDVADLPQHPISNTGEFLNEIEEVLEGWSSTLWTFTLN